MNLMIANNQYQRQKAISGLLWIGSLCAMGACQRLHRVQVKMQLLEEARSLAHGAREAHQTLRQVSIVPVFGL